MTDARPSGRADGVGVCHRIAVTGDGNPALSTTGREHPVRIGPLRWV
ncbi:MAG: hypothetical protein ABEJ58_05060 [Halodesulfurarchaeum sp.]